jgi:hypothetical protein
VQKSTEKNLSFERGEIEVKWWQIVTSWNKFIKNTWDREDGRQEFVNYAYQIGGKDLVRLIECENEKRDMHRKAYWNEDSWGFCQINRVWHSNIVDNSLFWSDWKWQLDRCNELMKWWTAFYGRDRDINWVRCSEYVKDRFTLEE